MAELSLLAQVALDLEQNENSSRIKKLIYFLSTNHWENNLKIIENYALADLIKNVVQNYPTLDELTSAVYEIVQSLNRQGVYSLVGKTVISKLTYFYEDETENTQIVVGFPNKATEYPQQHIVTNLEKNKNSARIKKLIFALCKRRWENDLKVIETYGYPALLTELQQTYPTLTQLNNALYQIVQSLNRKEIYVEVAKTIINQVKPLYNRGENTAEVKVIPENQTTETNEESTGIVASVESTGIVAGKKQIEIAAEEKLPEVIRINSAETENSFVIDTAASISDSRFTPTETSAQSPEKINYDVFEFRREIMNYTNPLRVKILVFSILHRRFDYSEHDWALLKGHDLDELLENLFATCSTLAELQAKISSVVESLPEAEENNQAAGAIMQLIKPFYLN
ncbi:MAG: hypothetical protein SAJ37_05930 [Oscillatoria sp. PMC 1068.18]|nr:hypothetical protein [Oscillatoria sp. PMC 1076.18]MEC4988271.1 hypothetical protein [Oscillatoria sp. PMC 1068.18]